MTIYKYQQNFNNMNSLSVSEINLVNQSIINTEIINIKKIQFNNTNKLIINHLIEEHIILKWQQMKKINSLNQIKKFLKIIQTSGFFYYIKTLKFSHSNKYSESFILTIKLNPILKKINILKYDRLAIPKSFLKYIFESQVGLPKNYYKIYKSIKEIQKWYQRKGFKFINIKLIHQDIKNDISIEINEGIIGKIEFFCKNNHLFNTEFIYNLNELIRQELNIKSGYALNIKSLELSLMNLRKSQIFKDCKYKIDYNNKDISLKIYYHISKDPTFSLYFKNQFIKKQKNLIETLYGYIIFFKFINKPISQIKILNLISYTKKLKHNFKLNYCYNNYQNKYINYSKISINLNNKLQRINLDIVKYFLSIKNQSKIISTLILNKNNQLSESNFFYPFISINKNTNKYNQITNLILKYKSINIVLNHRLTKYSKIIENLSILNYSYSKKYLDLNTLNFRKKFEINHNIYKTIYKLKKYSKNIKYIIAYIEISIKYNSLYIIQSIPIGKFLNINSKLFHTIIPNISYSINKLEYLGQIIHSKYLHRFYLPEILPFIYKSIFLFVIEINYILNKSLLLPIYINNYYKNTLSYYNLLINIPKNSYCLLQIELHIYKWKYTSLYFFYNLINNSFNTANCRKIKLQNYFQFNIENQGLGIQLNIPIKKLSNLKIKYIKNNMDEYSVEISNHLKYN